MDLLTKVIAETISKKCNDGSFGVSLINIPSVNYADLVSNISLSKKTEIFFLGFYDKEIKAMELDKNDNINFYYTVEEAEISRNTGDESIFRILVIKRQDIEKLSSLRWFEEIDMTETYKAICNYTIKHIKAKNSTIINLIKALKRKSIQSVLSFENVLAYLGGIMSASEEELPQVVRTELYKLGLCADKSFAIGNVDIDDFVKSIKRNATIVKRIGGLEQKERQGINNYYTKHPESSVTKLILKYRDIKDISILRDMDIEEVEACLKAVSASKKKPTGKKKSNGGKISQTTAAAQLIFDGSKEEIEEVISEFVERVKNQENPDKPEKIEVEVGDNKMQVNREPVSKTVATEMASKRNYGACIFAEVDNVRAAIDGYNDKYYHKDFGEEFIKQIKDWLKTSLQYIPDLSIVNAFDEYLLCRDIIYDEYTRLVTDEYGQIRDEMEGYSIAERLHDIPMLQVISNIKIFSDYINAYEKLLAAINVEFPKISTMIAQSVAKDIVNYIMAMDYVFVIGESKFHAIPTPMNPMYLWKYVRLAEEILESKGIDGSEVASINEDDKSFIIRKAEDIPEPVSIVMITKMLREEGAVYLPIAGKLGNLPIYSTQPQINEGNSGIEIVKQSVVRYMCLYPHASMMLRITFVNSPSVENVIAMLKKLDAERDLSSFGVDISIYRTKEAPSHWVEITDKSLQEGLLGKIKNGKNMHFSLNIKNETIDYDKLLQELGKKKQHLIVIFDPNEKEIRTAKSERYNHIHPLCVPMVYQYNPFKDEVDIRPSNEGGIFSYYSSILEKLNEHSSSFAHTSIFSRSPIKKETYNSLLENTDWMIILDQNLKSWDISLQSESEKLFYKEDECRSIGIYSKNSKKFSLGYKKTIESLGNYIASEKGLENIITTIRTINDDGLLSIVSHSTNRIFDDNHGKGSLGLGIAAISYLKGNKEALLVGLDTQLAREWLSEREEGILPDLIGINLQGDDIRVDLIEVKTGSGDFRICGEQISGHAVEQVCVLDNLIKEIFGRSEKITTVSRREILRHHVFESLYNAEITNTEKHNLTEKLNQLFAGELDLKIKKNIVFVDFNSADTKSEILEAGDSLIGNKIIFTKIGSSVIQKILSGIEVDENLFLQTEQANEIFVNTGNDASIPKTDNDVSESVSENFEEKAEDTTGVTNKEVEQVTEMYEDKENVNIVHTSEKEQEKLFIKEKCYRLNKVLRDFGIKAVPITEENVLVAARFVRFKIELRSGETIRNLEKYKQDISREIEAFGEIMIDNIKGTRYVGMDVPFEKNGNTLELLDNLNLLNASNGNLDVLAGQKPDSSIDILDVSKAPHILISGTTGSGKTVFLYSMIVSLISQHSKDDLQIVIVDPKQTDFHFFKGIPHLRDDKIITDPEEALKMLDEINSIEKECRTQLLIESNCRDIESYNAKNPSNRMKRLVVVIDEYADLVKAAEMLGIRKDFEARLCMLAQRVRNLGIHLVIATQRPSASIVTTALKANIPVRISFRLPAHQDSMTILDRTGAEDLLGKGDMLALTETDYYRMQGFYISEDDLQEYLRKLRDE